MTVTMRSGCSSSWLPGTQNCNIKCAALIQVYSAEWDVLVLWGGWEMQSEMLLLHSASPDTSGCSTHHQLHTRKFEWSGFSYHLDHGRCHVENKDETVLLAYVEDVRPGRHAPSSTHNWEDTEVIWTGLRPWLPPAMCVCILYVRYGSIIQQASCIHSCTLACYGEDTYCRKCVGRQNNILFLGLHMGTDPLPQCAIYIYIEQGLLYCYTLPPHTHVLLLASSIVATTCSDRDIPDRSAVFWGATWPGNSARRGGPYSAGRTRTNLRSPAPSCWWASIR